jgi:F-type H+-transporting ATPase subunit a
MAFNPLEQFLSFSFSFSINDTMNINNFFSASQLIKIIVTLNLLPRTIFSFDEKIQCFIFIYYYLVSQNTFLVFYYSKELYLIFFKSFILFFYYTVYLTYDLELLYYLYAITKITHDYYNINDFLISVQYIVLSKINFYLPYSTNLLNTFNNIKLNIINIRLIQDPFTLNFISQYALWTPFFRQNYLIYNLYSFTTKTFFLLINEASMVGQKYFNAYLAHLHLLQRHTFLDSDVDYVYNKLHCLRMMTTTMPSKINIQPIFLSESNIFSLIFDFFVKLYLLLYPIGQIVYIKIIIQDFFLSFYQLIYFKGFYAISDYFLNIFSLRKAYTLMVNPKFIYYDFYRHLYSVLLFEDFKRAYFFHLFFEFYKELLLIMQRQLYFLQAFCFWNICLLPSIYCSLIWILLQTLILYIVNIYNLVFKILYCYIVQYVFYGCKVILTFFFINTTFTVVCIFSLFLLIVLFLNFQQFLVIRNYSLLNIKFFRLVTSLLNDLLVLKKTKFIYFLWISLLFITLLIINIFGLIPYSFALSSQFSITFFFSFIFFLMMNYMGIVIHGIKILNLFFPSGAPIFIAPLLIFIEIISYFARIFSLAIRLFANITAGHILLKILNNFNWILIDFIFFSICGNIIILLLWVLECFITLLQAAVFTILICIYLNDVILLH